MPLQAKITNPAFVSTQAAGEGLSFKQLPEDPADDVLFNSTYGVRTITLNRPKKLNSLDGSMIRKIVPRLQEWTKSELANVIVIKGEGRAFCAGGDVASLAKQNHSKEGQHKSSVYFKHEYALDHYIATYPKPYVAFIDGITMGGGVGLSVHAPFRIATERTVFAMPETTIGLFPDVGASFFLPRLDGGLGLYLALTSEQLKGTGVFYAGIATHYLHSSSLPDLEARLGELQFRDNDSLDARLRIINSTIEEFTTGLPHDQPIAAPVAGDIRKAIDQVFSPKQSLEKILAALVDLQSNQEQSQEVKEWAKATASTIRKRSPFSCRATIEELRRGANLNITQAFELEQHLAANFMKHPDFVQGVTALLINKPKTEPKWQENKYTDAEIDALFKSDYSFTSLDVKPELGKYKQYPHAWTALPNQSAIEAYVKQNAPPDAKTVVQHFVKKAHGKLGVAEKVAEVLSRKTALDGTYKYLVWQS